MKYWNTKVTNSLTGLELKKHLHKKSILKNLYQEGVLPSTEICKKLGLSTPTTITYLNELVDEDIIENRGKGESIGGRKPNIFGLKKNAVFIVSIEVTKHHINSTIYNHEQEMVHEVQTIKSELSTETTIDDIYKHICNTINSANIEEEKIIGIGITMPGLIDSTVGINYSYLYNSKEPIIRYLETKLNKQVIIENDATARTYAELRYGVAKGHKNAVFVQLDWGVGAGLILDGKVYRGTSGFASEFAHIPLDPNGKQCACGKKGCLETLVSGDALVEKAIEGKNKNIGSLIHTFCKEYNNHITPDNIIHFANQGDSYSLKLIQEVGEELGRGIAYLIQILNPHYIILSGRVAKAKEYLETSLRQSLIKYCIPRVREDVEIAYSNLGENSGLLAASTIVMERIFESNIEQNTSK